MKKFIAALLTLGMLAGCGTQTAAPTPTAAATPAATPAYLDLGEPYPVELKEVGVSVELPGLFREGGKGVALLAGCGELMPNSGIYYLELDYYAMSRDRWNTLSAKQQADTITQQELDEIYDSIAILYTLLAVDQGRDFSVIKEITGVPLDETAVEELAKVKGVTYYKYSGHAKEQTTVPPEYLEEYVSLLTALDQAFAQARYTGPANMKTINQGTSLVWEGLDLAGEAADTGELFARHRLTMVNLWASWCGPCRQELPELERLSGLLAELDCAVVGIQVDSQEALEAGKQLLADAGVTYRNLQAPPDLEERLKFNAVPTSLFVDREGVVVGEALIGVPAGDIAGTYLERVKAALEEGEQQAAAPNQQGAYRVFVRDSQGEPVQKAKVQFCSDTQCLFADTDADGQAVFRAEEGKYTVHLLSVPQGYAKDDAQYDTLETYCDLFITIEKE